MRARFALLLVLFWGLSWGATALPAAAKGYSAERFDARIRLLQGGDLEVVETVVFRFEGGPFTHVFREIPTRRTDGVEILSAEMDGRPLTFGSESGQVDVEHQSKVRVRWNFAPRSDATHTFVLTYLVRGVVQKAAGGDLLEWIALPSHHAYRISTSEVTIDAPAQPYASPEIETRRVSHAQVEPDGRRVRIVARGIGKDGWLKARIRFADSAILAQAPRWQQRTAAASALAPRWATAAATVFLAGLVLMFALYQRYDSPARDGHTTSAIAGPPDQSRPAIAGAIASNGRVSMEHAMAALFSLADRGAVTITEEPRRWGQRQFTLHRRRTDVPQAPEEAALLELAFRSKEGNEASAPLNTARSRIQKRIREFQKPVLQELRALDLVDEDRSRVRSRFLVLSTGLLIVAVALAAPAAYLSRDYGGWPFLVAASVAAVAIVGFIFYGALTPLSNEGVRRAEGWRAFQAHLRDVARDRAHAARESPSQLLPFAVALGLAGAWAKYVKHHPHGVPTWFQALAAGSDEGGFPAFIAAGGASHGSGGGAGTGGAAGGGGSGAG
jgi:hypothetical protein